MKLNVIPQLSDRGAERLRIAALLAPAVIVIVVLFIGGLASGFLRSLNYFPLIGLVSPNLDAYFSIFTDKEFYLSLILTFYIAFVSTVISTVLAIGAALLLRKALRGKRIVNLFFSLNLTIPHLVGAIGILYLISQSGIFSRLTTSVGVTDRPADFPALVADPFAFGIILTYVWKETPFIGVIVLAILLSVGEDYESVARSLGAKGWQAFRFVTLPLIGPGVGSAFFIVFAFTFGAFEVPYLLGQTYPSALPVLAYESYSDVDLGGRPRAMAMAMVIAALSAIAIIAYTKLSRRYIRNG